MFSKSDQGKISKDVILCQCFGVQAYISFTNGFLLLYFLALDIPKTHVLAYLSMLGMINGLCMIPSAYYSDKLGKKFIGYIGNILQILGFSIMFFLPFFKGLYFLEILIFFGIFVYSLGITLFLSSWFPLLKPIISADKSGHFFATLRISWQLCGLFFSFLTAWYFKINSSIKVFQVIIFILIIFLIVRIFFYKRIPELKNKKLNKNEGIYKTFRQIIKGHGYIPFCAYIFLLGSFTFLCPSIFAIIEKEFMNLDSALVVTLANITLVGSLIGFWLGGMAVDKFGNKKVFFVCHFAYAFVIVLYLSRGFIPDTKMLIIGTSHFLLGFIIASVSLARTSETINMLPRENQSMASSIIFSATTLGTAVSGFFSAMIIELGCLKKEWLLWGVKMSNFDTILILCAFIILLLVITLGLLPSSNKNNKLPC